MGNKELGHQLFSNDLILRQFSVLLRNRDISDTGAEKKAWVSQLVASVTTPELITL